MVKTENYLDDLTVRSQETMTFHAGRRMMIFSASPGFNSGSPGRRSLWPLWFLKLNPHELVGGFDRLAIACLYGDAYKRGASDRPKRTPDLTVLLLESVAPRHQIAWSAAELVAHASVVLIGLFGPCSRARGPNGATA